MCLSHMVGILKRNSNFYFYLFSLPYCTFYMLKGFGGKANAEESREHYGAGRWFFKLGREFIPVPVATRATCYPRCSSREFIESSGNKKHS